MSYPIRHRPGCARTAETRRLMSLGISSPSLHDVECDCGAAEPELVACDCGHSVPAIHRMSASTGTACPDCYDRMS